MARAEIYSKWGNQGDGYRGSGGWSGSHGNGMSGLAGAIAELDQHAERIAWREACSVIRRHINNTAANFIGETYQIKFWVDQQICPTCQKWMVVDVISHLKLLKQLHPGLKVELYAEVVFAGKTNRVRVQRSTIWPVEVGNRPRYEDFKRSDEEGQ